MRQRKCKEKRLQSTWFLIGMRTIDNNIPRRVEYLDSQNYPTRKQAEREKAKYERAGWRVSLRHRELVMLYRNGRKRGRVCHITAYNPHGKERWY